MLELLSFICAFICKQNLPCLLSDRTLVFQVTRDYDEEEQGYDSDKAGEEEDDRRSESDSVSSPKDQEDMERDERQTSKRSKLNGDDRHQEDMEMSD